MSIADFWYVAAESRQLKKNKPLARKILNEWLVLFRDAQGKAVALRDRCLHRSARLSGGTVQKGQISCPYHGWTYDEHGKVTAIPSEGSGKPRIGEKCAKKYNVFECDGYVYVCLAENAQNVPAEPFRIVHFKEAGWQSIRLIHKFQNTVTNCVENFVDIPHTTSVHAGIFRSKRNQKITASIERRDGCVFVAYQNEDSNLGIFSKFLNPTKQNIRHTDSFYQPNVTKVEYEMGPHRKFIITSQSVPETDEETLVYTDLTFDYGVWNKLAVPFVWLQAKCIIWQDIVILKNQMETIKKYGDKFHNSPADLIHTMIESIREAIIAGNDARGLPNKIKTIEFWV